MFETISMAPADPILGLTEAFKADANPDKINLGVGVYKDEQGTTPIFTAVKKAEKRLLDSETTKGYLPITGSPAFTKAAAVLALGADSAPLAAGRAVTAQTPGGTGALRVAGDFLKAAYPNATLWVSDPTWANHKGIFGNAGFAVKTYAYYDPATKGLNFSAMLDAIRAIPDGDVLLLHACCHNPTGVDPTAEQWTAIADVLSTKKVMTIMDFAYQGFGTGIDDDALGVRILAEKLDELMIAGSFSKNFGLYNERVAALTLIAKTSDIAAAAFSNLKIAIRRNYSNPPSHGGTVVAEILNDPALRAEWETELTAVRARIQSMRTGLVEALAAKGVAGDFSFMTRQNGMFSFTGLTPEQVKTLKEKYAIYIVGSGRINVAGITPSNMDRLCSALADVMK